jgi:hypothetical protein
VKSDVDTVKLTATISGIAVSEKGDGIDSLQSALNDPTISESILQNLKNDTGIENVADEISVSFEGVTEKKISIPLIAESLLQQKALKGATEIKVHDTEGFGFNDRCRIGNDIYTCTLASERSSNVKLLDVSNKLISNCGSAGGTIIVNPALTTDYDKNIKVTVLSRGDLGDANFIKVKALCCSSLMMDFVKQLVDQENYVLCRKGGLAGVTWWYDCDTDEGNFADLKNALKKGADLSSKCPWLAKKGDACPARFSTCENFSESLPPCASPKGAR